MKQNELQWKYASLQQQQDWLFAAQPLCAIISATQYERQ